MHETSLSVKKLRLIANSATGSHLVETVTLPLGLVIGDFG